MNNEEMKKAIQNSMPEPPMGYNTRIAAKVDSLTAESSKPALFSRFSLRTAMVLALCVCLFMVGAVGFATLSNQSEVLTINPVLDHSVKMTESIGYTDNTVSVAGISVRDAVPGLTDKWYNVVPVDLTLQGRQTYRLVASNLYYIGELYVDVKDDDVTVTYATYRGNLTRRTECMNWFLSLDEITSDYMEYPVSPYAYGKSVSIQKDLKSAKVALLFVCNHVDYMLPFDNTGASLVRYWPNLDEWKEFRSGLNGLMSVLKTQDLVEYVEPTEEPAPEATEVPAEAPVTEEVVETVTETATEPEDETVSEETPSDESASDAPVAEETGSKK